MKLSISFFFLTEVLAGRAAVLRVDIKPIPHERTEAELVMAARKAHQPTSRSGRAGQPRSAESALVGDGVPTSGD